MVFGGDTERTPNRGRLVFFAIIALILFIWLFVRLITSPTQSSRDDAAWNAAMNYCINRIAGEKPIPETMSREMLQKVLFGICMQERGYELINEGQECPAVGYASCWRRKGR